MPEESQEFYQPVVTHPVTADAVQEDLVSRPFIREKPAISVDKSDTPTRYVVVSKDAGRSLEDLLVGKKVVWGGELPGDIYGDTDQKGSRHGMVHLEKTGYQSKRWRVHGMAEYISQVVEREDKVSILFRKHGLPTTRSREIHVISDDTLLPNPKGKYYPLRRWKEYALDRLKKRLSLSHASEIDSQVQSAKNWLDGMKFMVEVRDMQVAERLRSLAYCRIKEEFEGMIGPIFKWLNQATASRDSGLITDTERPAPFTMADADLRRYFLDWLPEQMGIYAGRLSKMGILHGNLTAQNWSAVGTVYDLDTCVGEPLGDPPVKSFTSDVGCYSRSFERAYK